MTIAEHSKVVLLVIGLLWNFPVATVIVTAAVLVLSLIRIKRTGVVVDGEQVYINKGVIIKRAACINISQITSVSSTRTWIDMMAGSTEITFFTEAGAVCGREGIKIYAESESALCARLGFVHNGIKKESNLFQTLLYAISSTSVTAGALVLIPILRQIDALFANNGLSGAADRIGEIGESIFGLSPIINLVATFILITFALSLLLSIARYMGHKSNLSGKTLSVSFGVLPKRTVYMRKSAINATFEIQPPFLALLKRTFIKADVAGVASVTGTTGVARMRREKIRGIYISPPDTETKNELRGLSAVRGGQWRYFATTFYVACACAPVFLAVQLLFPWLTDLILLFFCVLAAALLYRFYLANRARFTNIDLLEGNAYYIVGSRVVRARFCPVTVGSISLKTFPYDRKVQTCTVKVILRSEMGARIRTKYVSAAEIDEQFEKLHIK